MQDSRAVSGSQPVRSPQPLSHPQSASEVACSVEHQPSGLRGRQHPALLLCGHQRLQLLLLSAIRAAVTLRPAALRDMAGELEAGALLRHHLARRLGLFLQHRAGESPVLRSTLNAWGGSDALQGGNALVPRLLHIHWHNFGGLRGDINSQISLVSFPRQLLLCQGGRWWDDAGAGADIQAAWGCRRRDSEGSCTALALSLGPANIAEPTTTEWPAGPGMQELQGGFAMPPEPQRTVILPFMLCRLWFCPGQGDFAP